MITSFRCKPTPYLIFGQGKIGELPERLAAFGRRILLLTGSASLQSGPYWQPLLTACKGLAITIHIEQVTGEPSPDRIDAICAGYPPHSIDAVAAIGGGSVLDAGKAVAAMLIERKPLRLFLEGMGCEQPSGARLPFIAVPTTAGTGSEATSNAVFSERGKNGFKKSLRHDNYIPDIALIDPELAMGCPPNVTAACGMDTFSQLVEAYLSTNSSPFTDALALDGIQAVVRSLRRACHDGKDLTARADLAYASYLSGIVLANAGLGAVHGLAGPLGGLFPVPHGVACGLLMAPINRLTLAKLAGDETAEATREKYRQLGKISGGRKTTANREEVFLDFLDALSKELLPMRFGDFGIDSTTLKSIVSQGANKYNPVELSHQDFTHALAACI